MKPSCNINELNEANGKGLDRFSYLLQNSMAGMNYLRILGKMQRHTSGAYNEMHCHGTSGAMAGGGESASKLRRLPGE
jgi:hypothetical protein